jgi:hypothetical protein
MHRKVCNRVSPIIEYVVQGEPMNQHSSNEDLNGSEQRAESPWIKYAGMFRDDPDFAEIAAAIRAEREVKDDTEVDPTVYSLEA